MIVTGLVCFYLLVLIVSAKKGYFIGQCYMAAKWVLDILYGCICRRTVWMFVTILDNRISLLER